MELTELDILHGIFTSLFVLISLIVGLRILFKYFEHKRKELITVGIAWIGISTPWMGNSLSFLLYISFGLTLDLFSYLFIENFFVPIALVCWIYSFSKLVYPKLSTKLTILFGVICIVYEIFLITSLILKPEIIGALEGKFDVNHTIAANLFKVFAIIIVLITGVIFGNRLMRSDEPTTKWKGRFFQIAMLSFAIGAMLDAILTLTPLELVLVRLLLISSAIEYYLGFFLPEKVANMLIKQE